MQIAIYESLKKLMVKLGYTYEGNEREDDPVWATHHENGFRAMMEYLCGVAPHHIAVPTKVQEIHPSILNHPDFEAPVVIEAAVEEPAVAPAPAPTQPPAPPVVEAPAPAPTPAPAAPEVVEEIKQQFEAEQKTQVVEQAQAPAEQTAAAPAAEQPQQEQPAAQEGSSAQE
jgi:hypothetical protein